MKKVILILLFFSIFSLWPFLRNGYFKSHDGEWMVIRFTAFHQTLAGGQIPVRFVDRLNRNFGYPVLNFLYPLPFYLSEIPKLVGFGPVTSVKFTFIVGIVMSGLFMLWALRQRFSLFGSFTGAVLYIFMPYRFVDLYVRGSVGENLAFVFVPIIFGSLVKISKREKIYFPILSVSFALLILSHNVIALFFLVFFLLIGMLILKSGRVKTLLFVLLGLMSSAFFWLPALFDLQFVRLSQIKVSEIGNHLVSPLKLIVPSWGFGPNPNSADGMSVQFGIVSLVLFLVFLIFALKKKRESLPIALIITYTVVFFLLTKYSVLFWRIPGFDIVQFPWRLLSLIVFITAIFAAFLVDHFSRPKLTACFIASAAILSTLSYLKPDVFINYPDSYYETNEDTTTVRDEYLPIWVREKSNERANEKIIVGKNGSVMPISIKAASYAATVDLTDVENSVTVNTIYFPGWEVKANGVNVPIDYSNAMGLITFKLPKGKHDVIIKYNKTPVHQLSEIVSIAALITTGFFFFKWRKRSF